MNFFNKKNFFYLLILLISITIYPTQIFAKNFNSLNWGLTVAYGVNPTIYAHKQNRYRFFPTGADDQFSSLSFSDQSNLPQQISMEISYLNNPNSELFAEVNYTYSHGKTFRFITGPLSIAQKFNNYHHIAGFLGSRYFFHLNDSLKLFMGAKIGFIRRSRIQAEESFSGPFFIPSQTIPFYSRDTTVGGGPQVGLDYLINSNFIFGVKVEIIASGSRQAQVVLNNPPAPKVFVGNTGTILQFPISLFIKCKF